MSLVFPTPQEVCDIIKACAASGVARIEFGPLKVEFGLQQSALPTPIEPIDPRITARAEQEAVESAEFRMKQDQLSTMLLSDPAEYERLMMIGDLEETKADTDAE
jgi:hypothetical protein